MAVIGAETTAAWLDGPVARARARDRADDRLIFAVGLILVGGILGGMVLEINLFTTAAVVASLFASLVYPPIGLVVLAFMGPLVSPLVLPPPGLNSFLVASIFLGCVFRFPSERPHIRLTAPLLLLMAFMLYALVQQLPEMMTGYAGDRAHDIGYLFYNLATGLGCIAVTAIVVRGRSPYPYLAALLLSAVFAAVLALITADDLPFARLANLIPPSDGDGRATGPFGNPNAFGQFLAYATTLSLALVFIIRSTRARVVLLGAIGIMLYAMFTSLSRGGAAALLAGVVTLAFTQGRRAGIVTLVIAVTLAVVVYPIFVEWRLTTLEGGVTGEAYATLANSDGGRLEAVLAAPKLLALSPVFGIGFGQYKFMTAQVTDDRLSIVAHNWYGTVLAEQGVLGLALWLLMLLAVVLALRSRPPAQRRVGYSVFAAFVVGCFFLQPPTLFQLAIIPAIVVPAALVGDWTVRRSRAASGRAESRGTLPAFSTEVALARSGGLAAPGGTANASSVAS